MDDEALNSIPVIPPLEELALPPTLPEVKKAIKALKCGKAPGSDGLSPEIFKHGGNGLLRRLHKLFLKIWTHETVSQNFKDVSK